MSTFNFENGEVRPEMCSFKIVGGMEEAKKKYSEGNTLLWSFNPQSWGIKVWFKHSSEESHLFIDPEGDHTDTKGYLCQGEVKLFPGTESAPFAKKLFGLVSVVISKEFPFNPSTKK